MEDCARAVVRSKLLYGGLFLDVDDDVESVLSKGEFERALRFTDAMWYSHTGGFGGYVKYASSNFWVKDRGMFRLVISRLSLGCDRAAKLIDFHLFSFYMQCVLQRRRVLGGVFLKSFAESVYAVRVCVSVKQHCDMHLHDILSSKGIYVSKANRVNALLRILCWMFKGSPFMKSSNMLKTIPRLLLSIDPGDLVEVMRDSRCSELVSRFCASGGLLWMFQYLLLLPGNFVFREAVCGTSSSTGTMKSLLLTRLIVCQEREVLGYNDLKKNLVECMCCLPEFPALMRWRNGCGRNVMHYIANHNENYDYGSLVTLFANMHVRVAMRITDESGYTPLTASVAHGRYEMPGIIVSVDPSLAVEKDGKFMSAIHHAVSYTTPTRMTHMRMAMVQNLPLISMLHYLVGSVAVCPSRVLGDPVGNQDCASGALIRAINRNKLLCVRSLIEFDRDAALNIRAICGGSILHHIFTVCERMFTLVNVMEVVESFCSKDKLCPECVVGRYCECYCLKLLEIRDYSGRNVIQVLEVSVLCVSEGVFLNMMQGMYLKRMCGDVLEYIKSVEGRGSLGRKRPREEIDLTLFHLIYPTELDVMRADRDLERVLQLNSGFV